jgi:lysozyme
MKYTLGQLIHTLAEFLKPFEGLHKKLKSGLIGPYLCPAGYPTQGYGLLVPSLSVDPITPDEAGNRLLGVLPFYIDKALTMSPVLRRCELEIVVAIADFIFNLGEARYKVSTLKRKVDSENWEAACEELKRWVFGGGKKLPGLVARRAAEIKLIESVI